MSTKQQDHSYTVVYRVGGTARCTWVRALPVATRAEAAAMAAAVERQGYKALFAKTAYWDTIGLPEGWDSRDLEYADDYVATAGDVE